VHTTKYIIIAPIFCAAVIFALYKIKKGCGLCSPNINTADVKIGTAVLVIVLTVLNTLNFISSDTPLFPFVIWGAFMALLICTAVFYYQSCKNVKRIIDLLNEAGTYKDTADALFIGFLHFGTTMPSRDFSKERRIYLKGFKDFAFTVFEQNGALTEERFFELIALQKIVRKYRLGVTLLVGVMCTWFLMLPGGVITAFVRLT